MEVQEYIAQKYDLYQLFLSFIEGENEKDEINQRLLFDYFEKSKISENSNDLQIFLLLVNAVSENHQRNEFFYTRIEKIMIYLKNSIKQTLSNPEYFKFFAKNKILILILFKNDIIDKNESVLRRLINYNRERTNHLTHFFYPEILTSSNLKIFLPRKEELLSINPHVFDSFEEKRQFGENESYLTKLIRKDLIKEFVVYTNKINMPICTTKIEQSIFETNQLLIERKPSLIEYSAFFGSIKIFNYLRMKGAKLTPSLWLYAIHGRNIRIIHLLEDLQIKPSSYSQCLNEAIKCHHNVIANYIYTNFIQEDEEKFNIDALMKIFMLMVSNIIIMNSFQKIFSIINFYSYILANIIILHL